MLWGEGHDCENEFEMLPLSDVINIRKKFSSEIQPFV